MIQLFCAKRSTALTEARIPISPRIPPWFKNNWSKCSVRIRTARSLPRGKSTTRTPPFPLKLKDEPRTVRVWPTWRWPRWCCRCLSATRATQGIRTDQAKVFDTAIESTRANPQNTLANLAESTGGMLIANTNDLGTPLHKLAEDIQTYYEIGYAPQIKSYDGSFRKIAIKMSSSDLRVQSRSGYVALPPGLASQGSVLKAYEVRLLTALSSAELPKTFVYQSMPMHFRGPQNHPVYVYMWIVRSAV